jgi:hypothetical protein
VVGWLRFAAAGQRERTRQEDLTALWQPLPARLSVEKFLGGRGSLFLQREHLIAGLDGGRPGYADGVLDALVRGAAQRMGRQRTLGGLA